MKNKTIKTLIMAALCGALLAAGCSAPAQEPADASASQPTEQAAAQPADSSAQQAGQQAAMPDKQAAAQPADSGDQTEASGASSMDTDFYNVTLEGIGSLNEMTFNYSDTWDSSIEGQTMMFNPVDAEYPYMRFFSAAIDEVGFDEQQTATLKDGRADAVRDLLAELADAIALAENGEMDSVDAADIGGQPGIRFQYSIPDNELLMVEAMAVYGDYYYDIRLCVPMGFAGSSQQPYNELFDAVLDTVKFE